MSDFTPIFHEQEALPNVHLVPLFFILLVEWFIHGTKLTDGAKEISFPKYAWSRFIDLEM